MVEKIIRFSQLTPFKGRGGYGLKAENRVGRFDFKLGESEFYNAERLLKVAPAIKGAITGKTILDFGSGYGGKAVFYSQYSKEVCGVEPFVHVVEYSRQFAASKGALNVSFEVCEQLEIPFSNNKFDSVISHDVLEHVANPSVSLAEISRVLKPGGRALIIFPSYDGAFSHHLDYVTLVPCLHWLFKPELIVKSVNKYLRSFDCNTAQQPSPELSWDSKRYVLPTLNGLTYQDFVTEAKRHFEIVSIKYIPIGYRGDGPYQKALKFISTLLMLFSKERFAMSGVFELRKRDD